MKSIVRGAVLVTLAGTGVFAVACASGPDLRPGEQEPFELRQVGPISCPDFQLETTTFTVTPSGGTFRIEPGHSLEFGEGAVSEPTQFTVEKGEHATAPLYYAEIRIIREDGATTFEGDVLLDLSYASCPGIDDGDLTLIKTNPPRKNIGGRNDQARRAVRALVPHLSMFAIAR